ncbi:alpha/beta fold hydrolase [Chitinophaga sp. Mgbs1]|uniref:Alpha/beta fold hydrolase n=1 Tax=Chitinophaga solisilvae TaxID=1233460 RepID=A0A433WJZ0_9BACT|nr:alpha/beta fold hydrolase [Chitinophaga solisilvae]
MQTDYQIFEAGDVVLQSGITLPDCRIAYKTYGRLNSAKDNAILYPTWFSGRHTDNEWLIGPQMALNPEQYFIIVPNMLGNGLSSSPSNTPPPFNGAYFPQVTLYDNVRLQHRLLTGHLGVRHIQLAVGWSMAAAQVYQWGALYPDMVARIAPFCGTPRTSPHTFVFLEGLAAALKGGITPEQGLRAMARVLAGWAFTQNFYREELFRTALGFASLEDFLRGFWEASFLSWDPQDILSMIKTGQYGADISANEVFQHDHVRALNAIRARALVMPSSTDMYFPVEDHRLAVEHMPNATLVPVPSIWGHFAGGRGIHPPDTAFIDDHLKVLLASQS